MQGLLNKWVLLVLTGGALVAAGLWWWQSRDGAKPSLVTAEVRRGDVTATISATGTIEPLEVVDVGAQIAGRVAAFGTDKAGKTVDYGSLVERGELLAKIDDSVYAADLSVARAGQQSAAANLEQMSAKLDQATADWNRAQALFADKLISQTDHDTAKANHAVARANVSVARSGVAQAQADLEKAERNLAFCTISSPVSGVIIDRRVNIGQTVVSSLNAPSLFLIARDLTRMQIWVSLNEADVGRVRVGGLATFTVDAFSGREFQGRVGKIRLNATMAQNVVLYTVEIDIDNPDRLLLPYLTANVRFVLGQERNVLLVPNAALRWTPSSVAQIAPEVRPAGQTDLVADPPVGSRPPAGGRGPSSSRRTVWVKDGEFVRPLEVAAGITDGVNTVVTAEGLREGLPVVTAEAAAARSDVKNPFLPRILRR
ncbi:MAG TPA: efflux RND transporter periplasmic adaptor subunit [Vicinamibacteria bacterium]|nr:efflux RND transporter periplasmic adaptor subunit [Vicinamibacteria bacterium]